MCPVSFIKTLYNCGVIHVAQCLCFVNDLWIVAQFNMRAIRIVGLLV